MQKQAEAKWDGVINPQNYNFKYDENMTKWRKGDLLLHNIELFVLFFNEFNRVEYFQIAISCLILI